MSVLVSFSVLVWWWLGWMNYLVFTSCFLRPAAQKDVYLRDLLTNLSVPTCHWSVDVHMSEHFLYFSAMSALKLRCVVHSSYAGEVKRSILKCLHSCSDVPESGLRCSSACSSLLKHVSLSDEALIRSELRFVPCQTGSKNTMSTSPEEVVTQRRRVLSVLRVTVFTGVNGVGE